MKRDLHDAPMLIHRMVLLKRGIVEIKGVQPIEWDGAWIGVIAAIEPVIESEELVDYTLSVRISFGTAQENRVIKIAFSDKRWKLRFPAKEER